MKTLTVNDVAVLTLTLAGTPPVVRLDRGDLDGDSWYRVSLLLGSGTQSITPMLDVPPEDLLRLKGELQAIQLAHGFGLVADEGVTSLLRRSMADAAAFGEALAGIAHPISEPVQTEVSLLRELRPFQQENLADLLNLKHGANFSVPGAGKTTVTYAVYAAARNAGHVDKLLVVAPYSAFGAWEEDAAAVLDPPPRVTRWRPGTTPIGDVVLIAYPQLPSARSAAIAWMLNHQVHLVADEAHRAKRGPAGKWGNALMAMAPFATRRDILTGTPAPNHPRDLAALLEFLWPGARAAAVLPPSAMRQEPPDSAMAAIQQAIRPLYVRTTKSDLELPEVDVICEPVPMGPLQAQIYSALRNKYAGSLTVGSRDQAMFAMMGEVSMYLLQAASSPKLLADAIGPHAYRYPSLAIPEGSRLAGLIETYADHEVPSKIATACRIVYQNATADPPRKTLVWSNFPANLLDLQQQLAALEPAVIYGGVPTDEEDPRSRDRELARFKSDPKCLVLLANPAAMSEGVSLHHVCHDAVYVDRTFNAGQYLQSLDRIHRLGLPPETETRVTLLASEGTIDGRVHLRVTGKARRLSQMLADPGLMQMALPDEDGPTNFHDDDLDLAEVLEHLAEGLPQFE